MKNNFTSQPVLEIFLLGRFQVKIDGVPIDEKIWVRRSAKSLVKLLTLKPFHALHREQIMDLLWAEQSPETGVNNLNKAIYRARRSFEPDLAKGSKSRFILTQKNQVILDSPGSLFVDLDEFERLANYALHNNDLETGQKAIELYRGDLLTEDIYEDWIFTRRESMQILFRKTATKTAEIYAARGDQSASIEILNKLIAEDATDEHIQRLLMRFYAETGSKYQALKQFENCRAALRAFGIEPDTETIRLEQSIKRGEIIPAQKKFKAAPAQTNAPIAISSPHITPLTFQNGIIKSAKFLPDGKTIVLSADWDGDVSELYTLSLKTNEIYRLGIKDAEVYAVSSAGEIAAALKPRFWNVFNSIATLAKPSLSGESPRKLLKDVQYADWHPSKNAHTSLPDEQFLAVVSEKNGKNFLEYPIGNTIYKTGGWLSHPRFSPDGKKIAFIEHPIPMDDEGYIVVLDLEDKDRNKQILTDKWITAQGLAWLKDEIWFTASRKGTQRMLNAVDLKGVERPIYRGIGNLKLHDISKSGAVLVTDDKRQSRTIVRHAADGIERDLSWHEHTFPRDISDDGETLLIEESGTVSRDHYSAYIRKIDGSSTKIIGSGAPLALSPDEKYVLLRIPSPDNHLALLTIETGEIKPLEKDSANSLIYQEYVCFFPDGKRFLFAANEIDGGTRIYIQNIDGGSPDCFTPDEGVRMYCNHSISPDGKQVVLKNPENKLALYQIKDGTSSLLKNLGKEFYLTRWTDDGENIFIRQMNELPTVIYKYNMASGAKQKWLELIPKDLAGINQITSMKLTPDGKTYAYAYIQEFSDLYLMKDFE